MDDIRHHAHRWWVEATGIAAAIVMIAIGHTVIAAVLLALTALSIVGEVRAGNGWSMSFGTPGITARWISDLRGDRGELTLFGTATNWRWCYVCAHMCEAATLGVGRKPRRLKPGQAIQRPTLGGEIRAVANDAGEVSIYATGITHDGEYRVDLSRTLNGWTVNGRGRADRTQVANVAYTIAVLMLPESPING